MPRFSVRWMLGFVVVAGIITGAFLRPHFYWSTTIATVATLICLIMIASAIGSNGKLRLQALSFLTVFIAFAFFVSVENSPIQNSYMAAQTFLRNALGTDRKTYPPSGEKVYLTDDGNYMLQKAGANKFENSSKEEIQALGLMKYVYSNSTAVSRTHFDRICKASIAMLLGLAGFFVTGWFHDRRQQPASSQAAAE